MTHGHGETHPLRPLAEEEKVEGDGKAAVGTRDKSLEEAQAQWDDDEVICSPCGPEIFPKAEDCTEEARRVKRAVDPALPTAAEWAEHLPTHLPFRSWCWACVACGDGSPQQRGERARAQALTLALR